MLLSGETYVVSLAMGLVGDPGARRRGGISKPASLRFPLSKVGILGSTSSGALGEADEVDDDAGEDDAVGRVGDDDGNVLERDGSDEPCGDGLVDVDARRDLPVTGLFLSVEGPSCA